MSKLTLIVMTVLSSITFYHSGLAQSFQIPGGSVLYASDITNRNFNNQFTYRNKIVLTLDPEIMGLGFNILGSYSVYSMPGNSFDGFTFNMKFDQQKYQSELLKEKSTGLSSQELKEYDDQKFNFDKLRNEISQPSFLAGEQLIRKQLRGIQDSLAQGYEIDTSYQESLNYGLIQKDSLRKSYEAAFNGYKNRGIKIPSTDSLDINREVADSSLSASKINYTELILSNLKGISIGYHQLHQSEISVYNFPISGISLEYGPKPFYIQASMGKRKYMGDYNYNVSPVSNNAYQDNQIKMIQAGLGDKFKTHAYLKWINYQVNDQMSHFSYSDCDLVGGEIQYVSSAGFMVNLELNGLLVSQRSETINSTNKKPFSEKVIISKSLFRHRSQVKISYINTGVGYNNPGNPNFPSSTSSYDVLVSSKLLKGKVVHRLQFKSLNSRVHYTRQDLISNNLLFSITKNISLSSTMIYTYSKTKYSDSYDIKYTGLNAITGLQYIRYYGKDRSISATCNYSFIKFGQNNLTNSGFCSIMHGINKELMVGISAGYNATQAENYLYENWDIGGHINYLFLKRLQTDFQAKWCLLEGGRTRLDFGQKFSLRISHKPIDLTMMVYEMLYRYSNSKYSDISISGSVGVNFKF